MKRTVVLGALMGLVTVACAGGVDARQEAPPSTVVQVAVPATDDLESPVPASIQALIDAAGPGDVVEVPTGSYEVGFTVETEQLTIVSPGWSSIGEAPGARFEIEVEAGVVYTSASVGAPEPGLSDLLLDVYRPVGLDGLAPALLVIHGGGFAAGSRENRNVVDLCRDLAARGQVCVSIDYRLRDDEPPTPGPNAGLRAIEAAVEDAAAALRWVHGNAETLGVDPERISIGGMSAGAITALAVAYEADTGLAVNGVVDLWGGLYDRVDVIDAGEPPMLIVHGTDDRVVPFGLTSDIVARASDVGVPFEAYPVVGAGHGVELDGTVGGRSLYERIARFVGR